MVRISGSKIKKTRPFSKNRVSNYSFVYVIRLIAEAQLAEAKMVQYLLEPEA